MNGHIAGKAIYLRIFAGTEHIHNRSVIGIGSWIGIGVALWILAWIIASAIPVLNNLLSLMVRLAFFLKEPLEFYAMLLTNANEQAALFFSWFTFALPGMFWLKMNKGLWFASKKKIALTVLNSFVIGLGLVLVSYSRIIEISAAFG